MRRDAWATDTSPRKFNSGLGASGPGRPGARRAGVGGRRARPPRARAPRARRSLTVQRRRRSGRPRPSSCGAPPRPAPGLPRPAPQPGPRPGAAPSARPRHTRPARNPPRRVPRCCGECLSGSASVSRPWGIRAASALPLGLDEAARSAGRKWENLGYRAQPGWAGRRRRLRRDRELWAAGGGAGRLALRIWAPLLLSGCSVPRGRTGARSTAGLAGGRSPERGAARLRF